MVRFFKIPAVLTWFFPGVLWEKKVQAKTLFLTFDDGPIPEITPYVLEQLRQYQAKATFFCVGDNVDRYPDLARQVQTEGHLLGNHTYHHVKAWQLTPNKYATEVLKCEDALKSALGSTHRQQLFRPPYGQITWAHLRQLIPEYQVVMWSSLSYDFDATISPQYCLQKTIKATGPGSIIVMHDSLKAEKNLRYVLPRLLQHFTTLGYSFQTL